jgi:hypothetical protein
MWSGASAIQTSDFPATGELDGRNESPRLVLFRRDCLAFTLFFRHQHGDDFVAVTAVDAEIRVQGEDRAVPVEFA